MIQLLPGDSNQTPNRLVTHSEYDSYQSDVIRTPLNQLAIERDIEKMYICIIIYVVCIAN